MIIPKHIEIDIDSIKPKRSASEIRIIESKVRHILSFDYSVKESLRGEDERNHYRFNMCGGDVAHNDMILNKFAPMGIHENVDFLCLRFHKGSPLIFLKCNGEYLEIDGMYGYGTVDIITAILLITKCY